MKSDPLIYQPDRTSPRTYRVAWYGGESTQLHFQRWCVVGIPNFDGGYEWVDIDVKTLMEMPTRVKELYTEMQEYYNHGITLEQQHFETLAEL